MPNKGFYERVVLLELQKAKDFLTFQDIKKRAMFNSIDTENAINSLLEKGKITKKIDSMDNYKNQISYKIVEGVLV